MRALFVLLLLANVGLFYWQIQWQPEPAVNTALPAENLPATVSRLQLLSEQAAVTEDDISLSTSASDQAETSLDQQTGDLVSGRLDDPPLDEGALKQVNPQLFDSEVAGPDMTEEEVTKPVRVCYVLGPFPEEEQAKTALSELNKAGFDAEERQDVERTLRGYWIFLPPQANYAAANEITKALHAKGIRDMFIMGKGEHQNAVSLGLYRTRSAAQDRFNQVKALGYAPEFEEQFRESSVIWLEVTLETADDAVATPLAEMASQYSDTTLTQKPCE